MSQNKDRRTSILEAALGLIAERGFHGTPAALIAERAGVGVGTIYRYFRDKDELIHAVFQDVEKRQIEIITRNYDEERPFRERFVHLCRNVYHCLMENPLEFRFLEQYFDSPYGVEQRRRLDNLSRPFGRLFFAGKEQQVLKDVPDKMLYSLVFGPIAFSIKEHNAGFLQLDAERIDLFIGALWDAIRR